MKNRNFLRFVGVLSLAAILFSSCSKDSLSKPSAQARSNGRNDADIPPTVMTGSIQATLQSSNATSTSIIINDDNGYVSEEIFADQNGLVRVDNLPEGTYTVTAHAYIPNSLASSVGGATDMIDVTITVTGVQVVADQVTDLGRISFD